MHRLSVVPLEGTWIEIKQIMTIPELMKVVPLEGTWIEISENDWDTSWDYGRTP